MSQRGAKVVAGQDATAKQYNLLFQAGDLFPHERDTPGMTIFVDKGVYYIGAGKYTFAGGASPSMTAPVTNPRIDVITLDTAGVVAVTAGSEGASPSAPTIPAGKIPICQIYHRVGATSIKDTDDSTNSYIHDDLRPFNLLALGDVLDNGTLTYNDDGTVATVVDTDASVTWTFSYGNDGEISSFTNGTNTWTLTRRDDGVVTAITKT